jgi:hypothetical protein
MIKCYIILSMKTIVTFAFLSLVLILTGCGMSKEDCLATDWQQLGYKDATVGKFPRNLTSAIKDCGQYSISVDKNAYNAGWNAGIKQYCTSDQGFTIGSKGLEMSTVCPVELQAKFAAGWRKGVKAYCAVPANAFAAGKAGQPFPTVCAQYDQAAFKNEYTRGQLIYSQIQNVQSRINNIQSEIDNKVNQYHLVKIYYSGDSYRLGDIRLPVAVEALSSVNHMVSERNMLSAEVTRLQNSL